MAGTRPLVSILLLTLLMLVAIVAVSGDDSGSSITTPVAQGPVGDYEGADTPEDSVVADDAEAPDAASLGAPENSGATGEATSESSTGKATSSSSSTVGMASIAVAATGALVSYLVL